MRTLLVLAILLATASAHADDVGVVVTGEATLQPPLAASVEGWLREHGHRLVSSPLEADAINALIDCFVLEDLGCARGVIERRSKSQTIVYARVEVATGGQGMGNVTLVAYWLQKGHDAVGERRSCNNCNPQQLATAADDLMHALAAEPPPPDPSAAPASPPTAAVHEQVETPASAMLWPKVLVGAGAAVAVTGGVMLAINSTPSRTGVQQPTYRDLGPPGYALLATGAAAIGVGVYLWFHERSKSAPVAAISLGGAVVGWTGRF
jgi:hypothetical protein